MAAVSELTESPGFGNVHGDEMEKADPL